MNRIVTVITLVVATLFVAATPATACTSPNWVEIDATELADVGPGADVRVTGGGYAPGPVQVRWNGRDGEVLATGRAGADGTFATRITIPQVSGGSYAVVALQEKDTDGHRMWGFIDVEIPGAAAPPRVTPNSTTQPELPTTYVAALLLLVAAGATALALHIRSRRRAERAALDAELAALLADNEHVSLSTDT